MKKIAALVLFLGLLAACDHGGGMGMEFDANPSISGDVSMEALTVKWFGEEGVEHSETEVTVDAARGITVYAELIDAEGNVLDSCSSSVELVEEDYQGVIAKITEANLVTYVMPVEGSPDCIVAEDPVDFGVVYEYRVGDEVLKKVFETDGCEVSPEIEELAALVGELAQANVLDCSAGQLSVDDQPE